LKIGDYLIMPRMKIATSEVTAIAQLPAPSMEANYSEEANNLTMNLVWDFNYDDTAIIERLGKLPADDDGNPTGEPKPVTSRTYGKAEKLFTGMTDGNGNPIYFVGKLIAETKEALQEKQKEEEKEEEKA
jgi:hypothetical protein